jgi:hypothetical protein
METVMGVSQQSMAEYFNRQERWKSRKKDKVAESI